MIEGFVEACLKKHFDTPSDIPHCHREWWDMCCHSHKFVAIAAPRGHAKSTAITLSYTLANILFRERKFVLLVSDTESQSSFFLGNIKKELSDNDDIKKLFGVSHFVKDTETDCIVEFDNGDQARILAKGSEQKLRGINWDNRRPDLIVCHEQDTDIYTPETGWIKNQDYPDAKLYKTHEAFEITFEDGFKEVVSGDHRYLTKEGWKYAWMLKPSDNVEESITDATMNAILKHEKKALTSTTINQKLRSVYNNGTKTMLVMSLLPAKSGITRIKKMFLQKLLSLLVRIPLGKQPTVQREGVLN